MYRSLRTSLARWFDAHARDLPWRRTSDPWLILLSEVVLQQTRVDQGLPYYKRFARRFPTPESMAQADVDEVLGLWEGLGYYSRARNLHRSASIICRNFDGRVPESYEDLLTLPGIGPYTAAAVSSIAFAGRHAVVDGNVVRVLSRLFAVDQDVSLSSTRKVLQNLADELLDPTSPGRHNEAVMELGAQICSPTLPACDQCPVATECLARQRGIQEMLPVKKRRAPVPHYDIAVGVITRKDGRLLIQKRPEDAMLGGLWEFPGGKTEAHERPEDACKREIREETGLDVEPGAKIAAIRHAYSHFKITLHAFRCAYQENGDALLLGDEKRWVAREELADYAFPRANRRLIELLTEGDS